MKINLLLNIMPIITTEMVVMTIIILGLFGVVIFIFGVARGIMLGRKEQLSKAERMAEHFTDLVCDVWKMA